MIEAPGGKRAMTDPQSLVATARKDVLSYAAPCGVNLNGSFSELTGLRMEQGYQIKAPLLAEPPFESRQLVISSANGLCDEGRGQTPATASLKDSCGLSCIAAPAVSVILPADQLAPCRSRMYPNGIAHQRRIKTKKRTPLHVHRS